MENASKALIIAGAILISIVLIAIGVMIVNSANNVVTRASDSMSDQDIQIFNAKFDKYEGNNKRGTDVKSLLGAINSNNATAKNSGGQEVAMDGSTFTFDNRNDVKDSARYNIEFSYDNNGCIYNCKITAVTTTTSPKPAGT